MELGSGGNAKAATYVECAVGDQVLWAVGIDRALDAAHRPGRPGALQQPPYEPGVPRGGPDAGDRLLCCHSHT